MASFTNDHTLLPMQTPGDPVFQIAHWRVPVINVYIPIHSTQTNLMFVYYSFRGLKRQVSIPPPFCLAQQTNQEFMVTEFGTVTSDGYRVPLARRRSAPVLATPPDNPPP